MNGMVNQQCNDEGLRELALFAGAGGGILGGKLLGWRTVCAVEYNAYARSVLLARQNDGTFPPFPVWDDVRTFMGKPWRGLVDVVSGGFPCQDISAASKGAGLDGERSGLWGEMARIVREVQPQYVFVENSPMLTSRGLGRVLGDLAEMGFDAEWGVISAADTGAFHLRERIWIVANASSRRCSKPRQGENEQSRRTEAISGSENVANPNPKRSHRRGACGAGRLESSDGSETMADCDCDCEQRIITSESEAQGRIEPGERSVGSRRYGFGQWPAEPGMGRVVDGMANRADRIKAIGNGQVPRVAATAWEVLKL